MMKSLTPWAENICMMCQRIGRPPISTIGFGRVSVSSERRVPKPPARITAFTFATPKRIACQEENMHLAMLFPGTLIDVRWLYQLPPRGETRAYPSRSPKQRDCSTMSTPPGQSYFRLTCRLYRATTAPYEQFQSPC
jgi:hypothetical protein